ncbi:MAG: hypothetical protein IKK66_11460 [Ruminococcus sp.]|nr:hypothetical protein [Ruminococcus sp.]
MVSMWCDGLLTNLRLYGSKLLNDRNVIALLGRKPRKSKIFGYEIPYCVTGTGELTGLDETPKDMYVKIGISERGKVGTQNWLHSEEALSRKFFDIT